MSEVRGLVWEVVKLVFDLFVILMSLLVLCGVLYHGYHGDYARAAYEGVIVVMLNRWSDKSVQR